ncbi:hypothetical protein MACK_000759 [Theileria orientalis]|uniref:Uncharacterized protein n=1 Tax=Theileria orientalis TaxID=68886 RepID=A0A976MAH8_THEOR|nr:hypothetical protein MACK_000759 [Theileria orientalis]
MVDDSRVDRLPSGEKKTNKKLEEVSNNKMRSKGVHDKKQQLELPSGILKRGSKSKRRRRAKAKKSEKTVKHTVEFAVAELMEKSGSSKGDNSESEGLNTSPECGTEFSSDETSDSNNEEEALAISETTNFELNEIYDAIDSINKLCLDPIKMKIKKDYIETKNKGTVIETNDEHRYNADINIILSSRKDTTADTVYMSIGKDQSNEDDFTLKVENITDTSEPDTPKESLICCNLFDFRKMDSDITKDSVRSLDNLTTPSKTSDDKTDSSTPPGMCEVNLSLKNPNVRVDVNASAFDNSNFEYGDSISHDDENIDSILESESEVRSCSVERSTKSASSRKSSMSNRSNRSGKSGRSSRSGRSGKSNMSNTSNKSNRSSMSNKSNKSGRSDRSGHSGKSSHKSGSYTDECSENQESKELADIHDQTPYYGRTLFYRFHSHGNRTFSRSNSNIAYPIPIKDPSCLSPYNLGFDSVASLHKSLNAPSEIIIKPPVTIGNSVSFRSKVDKCVLSEDKFITDSVFQINWLSTKKTHRKRSLLQC